MANGEFLKQQEEAVRKQFSQGRLRAKGQQRQTTDRLNRDLDRFAAVSGVGRGSGAVQKARQQALTEAGRQFAEVEGGLSAGEAQALAGVREGEQARQFARQERLGSQEFAATEAQKARELQESQFARSFGLSEKQLGIAERQMDLAFAEFDESVKANFINSIVALKDAGLKKPKDWIGIFGTLGFLGDAPGGLAGERFKGVLSEGFSALDDRTQQLIGGRGVNKKGQNI